jgi:sigma-B regulation protein RsbU (phosphoserine phosphatase)
MKTMPLATDEQARLKSLHDLGILHSGPDERFDAITRLVTKIFHVPIAYIALIDETEQWFKSQFGLNLCHTDRDIAFCHYAIQQDDIMVVEDATLDPRFADNPLVIGELHVRFYAGHPVRSPEGFKVATLCMMDRSPRTFSEHDREVLRMLAKMVERELSLVDAIDLQKNLLEIQADLVESEKKFRDELNQAAHYVESLLPGKMSDGRILTDWFYKPSALLGGDAFGQRWLDEDRMAFFILDVCGHGVSSALLSISVLNVLRGAPLDRFPFESPAGTLQRLNQAFPMEGNDSKYFTIWYGVLNQKTGELIYASAGHPPALLFPPGKTCGHSSLATKAMPIGWLPIHNFPEATVHVEPGAQVWIYSDGAYEFKQPDGEWYSFDRFTDLVCSHARSDQDSIPSTVRALYQLQGREEFEDDAAIFVLQLA